ncbi:hypothetical protein DSM107010_54100 [Chroococcidiopsis cubana SAG 39.79]|uniref:Uncharacterized protein n=1 Tax=Chroococcidiopsis cubana SAG 39.79 TaxID=388085 RepID=A0AB37UCH8_9CYAN|nr:hypothetical protein DSM107010_54100 [Chroococcidiopsis cubana SAG 39.79]
MHKLETEVFQDLCALTSQKLPNVRANKSVTKGVQGERVTSRKGTDFDNLASKRWENSARDC